MKDARHYFEGWKTVVTLAAVMVFCHLLQYLIPPVTSLGIVPRNPVGARGILFSPLLHSDWGHLLANLSAWLPLGLIYFWVHPRHGHQALVLLWLFSGATTWLIGRTALHIGSSGMVFALFGFLLGAGFFMRSWQAILGTVVVAAYYGPLLLGVLPTSRPISWEGHLAGFVVGVFVASRERPREVDSTASANGRGS